MHIAFVASECVPFAKTGGLADVVGALPEALARMGHQVTVWLPRYREVQLDAPRVVVPSITVPFDDRYRFPAVLDGGRRDGVQFYFIEYAPFFDREYLYNTPSGDYPDNAERFALYCRAVVEATKHTGVPDVFHAHDWQAALVPVLLRNLYEDDPLLGRVATVFTIHNLGYQGNFAPDVLPLLMLPWDLFTLNKMEFFGQVNFLKGALVYADILTTVSKKYAQEIQTPEYGFSLEGVLRQRSGALFGVLNGADYKEWDPATDAHIPARYTRDDLAGKAQDRRALLEAFGLDEVADKIPVLGFVSRFVDQKGFDLIQQVADRLMREPIVLVGLGSGEERYVELFQRLQGLFPARCKVKVGYDPALAHLIQAGSDMLLVPSRYEPCGLTQIYSMKYGTVPVVRATGGLDDTVEQWNPAAKTGTGFKFTPYTGEAMLAAVREAIATFADRETWQKLMRNGMARDFSWQNSAREYVRLYERAVAQRHGRR